MRARLVAFGGLSGNGETRNILFIQPGEKAARWLLSDDQHVIDTSELVEGEYDSRPRRTVATAVLVKSAGDEGGKGKVLLVDPSGQRVVEAADGVRKIQVASTATGDITLVYERERRLVLATFDSGSFARRSEQEIEVPPLK